MRMATLLAAAMAATIVVTGAAAQYRDRDDRHDRRDEHYRPHVTVFLHDDFRGRSMTIDRPIARLGETGMEDAISSIEVDGGAWQVCTDDDFRGHCEVIRHSIGRLDRMGMDDEISSIRPLGQRRQRY